MNRERSLLQDWVASLFLIDPLKGNGLVPGWLFYWTGTGMQIECKVPAVWKRKQSQQKTARLVRTTARRDQRDFVNLKEHRKQSSHHFCNLYC